MVHAPNPARVPDCGAVQRCRDPRCCTCRARHGQRGLRGSPRRYKPSPPPARPTVHRVARRSAPGIAVARHRAWPCAGASPCATLRRGLAIPLHRPCTHALPANIAVRPRALPGAEKLVGSERGVCAEVVADARAAYGEKLRALRAGDGCAPTRQIAHLVIPAGPRERSRASPCSQWRRPRCGPVTACSTPSAASLTKHRPASSPSRSDRGLQPAPRHHHQGP